MADGSQLLIEETSHACDWSALCLVAFSLWWVGLFYVDDSDYSYLYHASLCILQ